ISDDPAYALAYVGLADSYFELGRLEIRAPGELTPKAREAARKALNLDATLAEAHASLARIKVHYDWDWAGADAAFRRALELNPNYSLAHQWYSQYLTAMGRMTEALTEGQEALELDPLNLRIMAYLGWHYLYARQYDQAIDRLRKTLEMDPARAFANSYIGLAYLQKGMRSEATSALVRAVDLFKRSPRSEAELGAAFALLGQTRRARRMLYQLHEVSRERYVSPYSMATIYAGLNERDEAFQWLERAFRDRAVRLVYLKVDPMWDKLRSDARFDSLLRRLKLIH
ncbi:MAG: hypothetical protein HY315_03020, partial [Acidobacteria bacterium]|nr:hypothetical protein [Acidobacteriota bacterium]